MKHRTLCLLAIFASIVTTQISSCSKGTEPDQQENIVPTPVQLSYNDLVHFDTSKYCIALVSALGTELYYDGDYNMGVASVG